MTSDPDLLVPSGVDFGCQGGDKCVLFQRVDAGQVEKSAVFGAVLAVFFSLCLIGIVVRHQLVTLVLEPGKAFCTVTRGCGCGPWLRSGGIVFVLLAHECILRGAASHKKCCRPIVTSLQ